jgi:hypothetical protein
MPTGITAQDIPFSIGNPISDSGSTARRKKTLRLCQVGYHSGAETLSVFALRIP